MISSIWRLVLYRPIVNALAALVKLMPGGDVGLAIILLTLIIKFILYPLSKKSIDSQFKSMEIQAKMDKIAPELDKIKKSGLSKEEQARLTLELHKKHDIDTFAALSGCALQIPILIVILALYAAFRSGVDFGGGVLYSFIHIPTHVNLHFFGLVDLSKKSFLLAALAGISQYIMARFMPKPQAGADPKSFQSSLNKNMSMQMKYVFPFFIFLILSPIIPSLPLTGAVALYYITSNLFSAAQQFYEIRKREKASLLLTV